MKEHGFAWDKRERKYRKEILNREQLADFVHRIPATFKYRDSSHSLWFPSHTMPEAKKCLLGRINSQSSGIGFSISSTCLCFMSQHNNPESRIVIIIWPHWKLRPGRVACSGLHSLGAAMLRFIQILIFCGAPTLNHHRHSSFSTGPKQTEHHVDRHIQHAVNIWKLDKCPS